MIRFGLRLTLRGGKEAAARLFVTANAAALGVGLLLVTLAAINGVNAQNARYAWLNSGAPGATAPDATPSPHPLWGTLGTDLYDGRSIIRVDVAATGPQSPVPPGIPRLPEPGEYYASPAMSALLRDVPAAELGARYPGNQIGTIGRAALPGPDSLVVVVGRTVDDLAPVPGAALVGTIATKSPSTCPECRVGTRADGISLILAVTCGALLFPVLIFIATATRLSAARREQRFAAMRLVGATPGQVSLVAAVESTVAAMAGTAAGFGLFFLLRIPLASIAFTGEPFYRDDLSLRLIDVLAVAAGVPVAAAVVARLALRRVRLSPLGVIRRATPSAPRAYRLIPLVAGIAELTFFVGRRPDDTNGQTWAYLSGLVLMMIGLLLAGPWLTMAGSRFLARRTRDAATLIAARRLADNPKAAFRSVSGLVLALFVSTTAVGVMTTMAAERGVRADDTAASDTLMVDFSRGRARNGLPVDLLPPLDDSVTARLQSGPGVVGAAVIRTNPLGTKIDVGGWTTTAGLMSCQEFAGVPGFGRCEPGAEVASVPPDFGYFDRSTAAWRKTVWPTARMSPADLARLPAQAVVVRTNGSSQVIEQQRTMLAVAFPDYRSPVTVAEAKLEMSASKELAAYQQLVDVVIVVSLCIAGCSLAASVVAGLNDRKRPFSLLRLTGVPVGMLRRIVALETAVPLFVVSVVAVSLKNVAAHLFLRSQLHYPLQAPAPGYYLAVATGLLVSLAAILSTMPLLDRLTGPETARSE